MTHTMAKFLMELSLMDYSMLHYLPSQVAASALSLAMRLYSSDTSSQWVSSIMDKWYIENIVLCCILRGEGGSGI